MNIDISKLKALIRRLGFLRNYSSMLVPAGILAVAVLIFIPTQVMSSKLKRQIEQESISMGRRIESLSKTAVSGNQWKVVEDYQQAHKEDAEQIALLAKQSTQRQLLSYKIFPKPKGSSMLIFKEFGQLYCSAINELILSINGGDCPTDSELERSLQRAGSSASSLKGSRGYSNLQGLEATIVDALCQQRAESISVYLGPVELAGYEYWAGYGYSGMAEAVEDCWYWQIGYWVVEDVIDTIAAVNGRSNSVLKSPVKRFLSVVFGGGEASRKSTSAGERPRYVISFKDGITNPCTARLCDDDIDVLHFKVAVVLDAKEVLRFMEHLCSAKQHNFSGWFGEDSEQRFKHNQITILESRIVSVDRQNDVHNLYRYGDDAVVELDLVCEYILNKDGYDEIKPEAIKQLLKGPEEEKVTETKKAKTKRKRK